MYEMDGNANILKTTFSRSVIRSVHSFHYAEAQDIINSYFSSFNSFEKNIYDSRDEQSELAKSLRQMMKLAMILRKRRVENGALTLASTEIRFKKDENYQPIDIGMKLSLFISPDVYKHHDTNAMVEEWMLASNISVAQYIFEHFPNYACLRLETTLFIYLFCIV